MALSKQVVVVKKKRPRATWFERLMAAIALINLILVLFNLSYIPYRDHYLQLFPETTVWYGERFKGIEPERTTTHYLSLVDELIAYRNGQQDDSFNPQETLVALREQSTVIIDENPFAEAGKSGALEQIKNELRTYEDNDSAKEAFNQFWSSAEYSNPTDAANLQFFETEIRPLMETNYFRRINESGNPVDLFWQIDLGFMVLFALEFLARTFALSRRQPATSWLDAMLWRLYDIPMFIGFWRWLRVIPVTLKLHQAQWVNLEPVRNRLSRALVSQFAVELTEIVLLRVIDQAQRLIRDGDISRILIAATDRSQYVDINGVNEVETITKRLADVVVYQVLPKVKPELDALLQHSVVGALQQAPAYQGLKFMPGFEGLSQQISAQVVTELSKTLNQTLQNAFADKQGAALTSALFTSFGEHLSQEIQRADTMAEVRSLVVDLLEEIKINYVERIAEEDVEQRQEARYRIYGVTSRT